MSNSKEEKVFRKEGKKPSKGEENFALFCFLAFFSFLIVLAITFIILIIRNDPLQYALTTLTSKLFHFCCVLIPILFFLLLVSSLACASTSYTLILNENTLTYTSDFKTITLTLPCSSRREKDSIVLANGDIKISLTYDKEEEADLLEFLKDAIN